MVGKAKHPDKLPRNGGRKNKIPDYSGLRRGPKREASGRMKRRGLFSSDIYDLSQNPKRCPPLKGCFFFTPETFIKKDPSLTGVHGFSTAVSTCRSRPRRAGARASLDLLEVRMAFLLIPTQHGALRGSRGKAAGGAEWLVHPDQREVWDFRAACGERQRCPGHHGRLGVFGSQHARYARAKRTRGRQAKSASRGGTFYTLC